MIHSTAKQKIVRPDQTPIDWFRKFKPEDEQRIKSLTVKENKILRQLKKAFSRFKNKQNTRNDLDKYISSALILTKGIQLSSKDVTNFSLELAKLQEEVYIFPKSFPTVAGMFLCALIDACKDREITIITHGIEPTSSIEYLGYKNKKHLTVMGDVGHHLGYEMTGGKIIVKGDADSCIGVDMEGGEIVVEGKVGIGKEIGGSAGAHLKGGTVTIKGNAGYFIGDSGGNPIGGGRINLEGDYGNVSYNLIDADIYHKGRLIVDRGKMIKGNWKWIYAGATCGYKLMSEED